MSDNIAGHTVQKLSVTHLCIPASIWHSNPERLQELAVPGQQHLLDTSSPEWPPPMVIKVPWGRDEHIHDGGEVQKMLKFEKQRLTEEQKGGNPKALQGLE